MKTIEVISGVRYTPEHFLTHMGKVKKLNYIEFSHINTIYSLCWVFQFRVALPVTRKTTRYAGYYGGFEESTMVPGKLRFLPAHRPIEVDDAQILADKLTEEQALKATWDYNKLDIIRKFRSLNAPPVLEAYTVERVYKPMYVIRCYNRELRDTKYRVLDALSGDLDGIQVCGE